MNAWTVISYCSAKSWGQPDPRPTIRRRLWHSSSDGKTRPLATNSYRAWLTLPKTHSQKTPDWRFEVAALFTLELRLFCTACFTKISNTNNVLVRARCQLYYLVSVRHRSDNFRLFPIDTLSNSIWPVGSVITDQLSGSCDCYCQRGTLAATSERYLWSVLLAGVDDSAPCVIWTCEIQSRDNSLEVEYSGEEVYNLWEYRTSLEQD